LQQIDVSAQSADATEEKVSARLVPMAVIVEMITTEMSAAIKPYSIAVAPFSSRRTLEKIANMLVAPMKNCLSP
jgi:cell pole-organizing protein PopZ